MSSTGCGQGCTPPPLSLVTLNNYQSMRMRNKVLLFLGISSALVYISHIFVDSQFRYCRFNLQVNRI